MRRAPRGVAPALPCHLIALALAATLVAPSPVVFPLAMWLAHLSLGSGDVVSTGFSKCPQPSSPNFRPALARGPMPPKRAASKETQAETQAVNKRYRQAIDEVAEEYVCPITAELPTSTR